MEEVKNGNWLTRTVSAIGNWFKRIGRSVGKWFRGMKSELKKVVWPTWSQVLNNTLVVIVVSVIFAIILGVIDYLAGKGITALLSLIS